MNIIYFTTAIDGNDYDKYAVRWKESINPTTQIYHNKLIKCLSINNTVTVLSYRPFSRTLCIDKRLKKEHKEINGISYNYLKVKRSLQARKRSYTSQTRKLMEKINKEKALIVTDTLNTTVVEEAKKVAKRYSIPVVGVFTNSPSGVDGTPKEYTTHLLDICSDLDGYICTTDELNAYFNRGKKPYLRVEGIVENSTKTELSIKKPYIYYNGTLKEKFGVYNLIRAYKDLNLKDVDLYISGYQGDNEELKKKVLGNPNIHLLYNIPYKDVLNYEANAIANINCHPFSEDNDRYTVPFKVLDYLDSGVPTISVKNTRLMKLYKNDVIWLKTNDVDELKAAISKVVPLTKEERNDYAATGKEKVVRDYSYETTSISLDKFVNKFNK